MRKCLYCSYYTHFRVPSEKKNSFVAAVFFSLLSNYTYFSSERSAQKKDDRSVKQDLPKQCARRAKSSFHFKNAWKKNAHCWTSFLACLKLPFDSGFRAKLLCPWAQLLACKVSLLLADCISKSNLIRFYFFRDFLVSWRFQNNDH